MGHLILDQLQFPELLSKAAHTQHTAAIPGRSPIGASAEMEERTLWPQPLLVLLIIVLSLSKGEHVCPRLRFLIHGILQDYL